eukprot:4517175-Prymnesium_polylepis.1
MGVCVVVDERIPLSRRDIDLICVACDKLLTGRRPLSDAAYTAHSSDTNHAAAAARMALFKGVLEERSLALPIDDAVEGKSVLHMKCVPCNQLIKGTGTRFCTINFGQHCGKAVHIGNCESLGIESIESMPKVLRKVLDAK